MKQMKQPLPLDRTDPDVLEELSKLESQVGRRAIRCYIKLSMFISVDRYNINRDEAEWRGVRQFGYEDAQMAALRCSSTRT